MENLGYEDELQRLEEINEMVEELIENSSSDKKIDEDFTDEQLEEMMLIAQEIKTPLELEHFYKELEQGDHHE